MEGGSTKRKRVQYTATALLALRIKSYLSEVGQQSDRLKRFVDIDAMAQTLHNDNDEYRTKQFKVFKSSVEKTFRNLKNELAKISSNKKPIDHKQPVQGVRIPYATIVKACRVNLHREELDDTAHDDEAGNIDKVAEVDAEGPEHILEEGDEGLEREMEVEGERLERESEEDDEGLEWGQWDMEAEDEDEGLELGMEVEGDGLERETEVEGDGLERETEVEGDGLVRETEVANERLKRVMEVDADGLQRVVNKMAEQSKLSKTIKALHAVVAEKNKLKAFLVRMMETMGDQATEIQQLMEEYPQGDVGADGITTEHSADQRPNFSSPPFISEHIFDYDPDDWNGRDENPNGSSPSTIQQRRQSNIRCVAGVDEARTADGLQSEDDRHVNDDLRPTATIVQQVAVDEDDLADRVRLQAGDDRHVNDDIRPTATIVQQVAVDEDDLADRLRLQAGDDRHVNDDIRPTAAKVQQVTVDEDDLVDGFRLQSANDRHVNDDIRPAATIVQQVAVDEDDLVDGFRLQSGDDRHVNDDIRPTATIVQLVAVDEDDLVDGFRLQSANDTRVHNNDLRPTVAKVQQGTVDKVNLDCESYGRHPIDLDVEDDDDITLDDTDVQTSTDSVQYIADCIVSTTAPSPFVVIHAEDFKDVVGMDKEVVELDKEVVGVDSMEEQPTINNQRLDNTDKELEKEDPNLNRSPPRPLDMMGPEDLPIYEYKEERKEPKLYRSPLNLEMMGQEDFPVWDWSNESQEPESDDSISQSEVDAFALITPSTFQCDLCEYSNKEQRNLKIHMTMKHGGETRSTTYPCAHCDFVGKSQTILRKHMKVHGGETIRSALYPCTECDYVGIVERELQQHMRSHSHRQLCGTCGFVAENKIELFRHKQDAHKKFKLSKPVQPQVSGRSQDSYKPIGSEKAKYQNKSQPQGSEKVQYQNKPQGSEKVQYQNKHQGSEKVQCQNKPQGSEKVHNPNKSQGSKSLEAQYKTQGSEKVQYQNKPQGSEKVQYKNKPQGSDKVQCQNKPQASEKLNANNKSSLGVLTTRPTAKKQSSDKTIFAIKATSLPRKPAIIKERFIVSNKLKNKDREACHSRSPPTADQPSSKRRKLDVSEIPQRRLSGARTKHPNHPVNDKQHWLKDVQCERCKVFLGRGSLSRHMRLYCKGVSQVSSGRQISEQSCEAVQDKDSREPPSGQTCDAAAKDKPVKNLVQCKLCDVFIGKRSLKRHWRLTHKLLDESAGVAVSCLFCSFTANSQMSVDRHVKWRHGVQQTCDLCSKLVPSSPALRKHMNTKHTLGKK